MKRKSKSIISLMDSDFNQELLDKAILKNDSLEILKFLGEIEIDLEDNYEINNVDNSFSAHNEMGRLQNYGGSQPQVENLKILWCPSLEDVKYAEEAGFDSKKSESFIKKIINSDIELDLTDIVKSEKIEKLDTYIIDNLHDED